MVDMWLDDMRLAPAGWVHVKTVAEAKKLLKEGIVRAASLDHDLGDDELSGYDLVCWMEEHNHWPHKVPSVHSMNPVGRKKMMDVIRDHYGSC